MEGREKNFLGTPSSQRQNIDGQNSPAENTKNEVHDEKGSENNHGNEISKLPCVAHGILNLKAKHCKDNNTVVGRGTQIKNLQIWQFIFSTQVCSMFYLDPEKTQYKINNTIQQFLVSAFVAQFLACCLNALINVWGPSTNNVLGTKRWWGSFFIQDLMWTFTNLEIEWFGGKGSLGNFRVTLFMEDPFCKLAQQHEQHDTTTKSNRVLQEI